MPKIMRIYYDNAGYPYKDSALSVRYPIVEGNEFTGANNTTEVHFYTDNLSVSATWVANCKLPNNELVNRLLVPSVDEQGNTYQKLPLDRELTNFQGHLKIGLNGYAGNISIDEEELEENNIVVISGTPTIIATGIVDIAMNYSPVIIPLSDLTPTEYQQLLAIISTKLDITKGIYVIDDITNANYQDYALGQIFYDKESHLFYQRTTTGFVKENIDIANLEINGQTLSTVLQNIVSTFNNYYTKTQTDDLLATKVDKTNVANKVYGTDEYGNQKTIDVDDPLVGEGSIVRRVGSGGQIIVGNPQAPNHATPKSYVDTFAYDLAATINSTTYVMTLVLKDKNGNALATQSIDLPLESIVTSATYYDSYTYEGTTYTKVIVLVLSTTDVPTIIPVGDLISGLVSTTDLATALASYYTKTQIDTTLASYYTSLQVDGFLNLKADKATTYTKTETDNLLGNKQDALVSGTNIKTINGQSILGSGNYTFDDEFNESSTNAVQNQLISKEVKEINYELAVIREELFETVLTEIDYKVSYATIYAIPDTLTDTDGTHRVVFSETQLKTIEFNSVVMNQWVENGNFESTSGWEPYQASFSVSNNIGRMTATAQNGRVIRLLNTPLIVGHKYLIYAIVSQGLTVRLRVSSHNMFFAYNQLPSIFDCDYAYEQFWFYDDDASDWTEKTIEKAMLIDLTQMFGVGNEPTELTDVRIVWILSLGYITYNIGSISNTTTRGLDLIGQNIWDEKTIIADNRINSENFIRVLPNTTYYVKCPTGVDVRFFDENENVILNWQWYPVSNPLFTTPSGCSFIKFRATQGYGSTYNNDICINLSNASVNGTYKSYEKHTISVPQTIGKSAGTVHDYISVEEDTIVEGEQLYKLVLNSLASSYTFTSNETWTWNADGSYWSIVFDEGQLSNGSSISSNGIIFTLRGSNIRVRTADNSNITSSTNMNTIFPSGTTINFELATPTQTVIASGLRFDEISAIIQQGGTINALYENVPPNVETTFVVKKAVGA